MVFLSDLDGTLIDKEGIIKKEDVCAIRKWTKQHSFGFVTGRDEAFCADLMNRYSLSCDYLITNNGANAYYKNECTYASLIDLTDAIEICGFVMENHDVFYTNEKGERFYPIHKKGLNGLQDFLARNPSLTHFSSIDLIDSLHQRTLGISKISIQVKTDIDHWLSVYKKQFSSVEVMKTSIDYIEITSKGTNKWNAFKSLNVEDCAFIGDGENDRMMLENLEHTYVMNHAPKDILALGCIVDCVAQAIQLEGEKHV